MKVLSWNVNGIRACAKKGLLDLVTKEDPDFLCLQETKAEREQVPDILKTWTNRESHWSSANRRGYSGVATFYKVNPTEVKSGLGIDHFDTEGRFVILRYRQFDLYNIYFPNGAASPERHLFKQQFLNDLRIHLQDQIRQNRSLVIAGDFNIAHLPEDVFDPEGLGSTSGFLPEERAWFDRFLDLGMIDTFRHFFPEEKDRYTWWSYRERARPRNHGWRIDYVCVTKDLIDRIRRAEILDQVTGSDHCPVMIEIETLY